MATHLTHLKWPQSDQKWRLSHTCGEITLTRLTTRSALAAVCQQLCKLAPHGRATTRAPPALATGRREFGTSVDGRVESFFAQTNPNQNLRWAQSSLLGNPAPGKPSFLVCTLQAGGIFSLRLARSRPSHSWILKRGPLRLNSAIDRHTSSSLQTRSSVRQTTVTAHNCGWPEVASPTTPTDVPPFPRHDASRVQFHLWLPLGLLWVFSGVLWLAVVFLWIPTPQTEVFLFLLPQITPPSTPLRPRLAKLWGKPLPLSRISTTPLVHYMAFSLCTSPVHPPGANHLAAPAHRFRSDRCTGPGSFYFSPCSPVYLLVSPQYHIDINRSQILFTWKIKTLFMKDLLLLLPGTKIKTTQTAPEYLEVVKWCNFGSVMVGCGGLHRIFKETYSGINRVSQYPRLAIAQVWPEYHLRIGCGKLFCGWWLPAAVDQNSATRTTQESARTYPTIHRWLISCALIFIL